MVKRVTRKGSDKPRADAAEIAAAAPERAQPARRRSRSTAHAAEQIHQAAQNVRTNTMVRRGADALSGEAGGVAAAVVVGIGAAVLGAELLPGILIGAAAVLLGKMIPQAEGGVRPLARSVIGAGLAMADKARSVAGEVTEQMRDVVAEAQAERNAARGSKRNRLHGEPGESTAAHDSATRH